MLTVFSIVFAGGGIVFRTAWPRTTERPWDEALDLVCYHHYGKMRAAGSQSLQEQDAARAAVEDGFVAALDKLRPRVPVEQLLEFNGLVNNHRRIAALRHRIARQGPFATDPPTATLRDRLRDVQATTAVEATTFLHLSVCGNVDDSLE